MKISTDIKLDYSDVLIKPSFSSVNSRSHVNVTREFFGFPMPTYVPIIAANMATIGTIPMAKALSEYGMMTALHKFHDPSLIKGDLLNERWGKHSWFTMGISDNDFKKLEKLGEDVPLICVDIANGYIDDFYRALDKIRKMHPPSKIMAGNVCTPEAVIKLGEHGVDIIKGGIGSGAHCLSRLVAGVGYPQLSLTSECSDAAHSIGKLFCSDGGIRTIGDIGKALVAGADFVMVGSLLGGYDECDGEWKLDEFGRKVSLPVYGMASREALERHYEGDSSHRAYEGITKVIPFKGPITPFILQILGGIRSTCTYVGASSIFELPLKGSFIRVNRTHDVNNP